MSPIVLGFMKGLQTLPRPWRAWVALLAALNMVAPLFFLQTAEAWAVLAAITVAAGLQMYIFARKGFVKLLGLGHIAPWAALLPWLAGRASSVGTDSIFGVWIAALLAANGASFLIDLVDVARYVLGETEPSYVLEER